MRELPSRASLRCERFSQGKKNLPQAEAVLSVIHAGNDADLKQALTQLAGGMTRPLEQLRSDFLNLLADVEAGLDFVDEDIEFVSKDAMLGRIAIGMAHLVNAQKQLERRGISGRAIRVAIVGEPNAGKSSLFNALLERPDAIVSDQVGTTRDYFASHPRLGRDIDPTDRHCGLANQHATKSIPKPRRSANLNRLKQTSCYGACRSLTPHCQCRHSRSDVQHLLVRTKSDLYATNGTHNRWHPLHGNVRTMDYDSAKAST